MIVTSAPPPTRALVETAVEEALARITARSARIDRRSADLAAAIARASRGGKRVRPTLVVEAFRAFDGDPGQTPAVLAVAAAYELLHTAFVVHDDVIDHDDERRGVPNISGEYRRWGEARGADAPRAALLGTAAAIVAGDLLLFEATRSIALADVTPAARGRLLDLLDDAIRVSAAGELADVENAILPDDATTSDLLRVAHDKTAVYTFIAPLCSGALLAGASEAEMRALAHVGGQLGLAFQLVDDLIGAFGTDDQAGREAGADLREAKRTPIVGLARESDEWSEVAAALALAPTGPVAVRDAQRALESSGARNRTRTMIDGALADARSSASALPPRAEALVQALAGDVERRIP